MEVATQSEIKCHLKKKKPHVVPVSDTDTTFAIANALQISCC